MLQNIVDFCVRLRVLVVALAAMLLVAGVSQLREMRLDVIPEFANPSLKVATEALGLSTSEVESLITVPMEADLLNGVPWMRSIESESITGLSSIEMFFAPGTDLLKARQMVSERLVQAHALPNVSKPPIMLQDTSSSGDILSIGMTSKTVSLIDMSVLARWTIVPRLIGVPGVANVAVWGMRDRQLQVQVDPAKLNAKGVTLDQVVKTAGESVWASPLTYLNSSTPGSGGFIDTPNQRLGVRHISPTNSPERFAQVPVHGSSVALGDVATVVESNQPLIGDALYKDGPGLMLVVEKTPGANTVDVTRAVEAAMEELKQGMKGIEVDTSIYRPASFIERAKLNLALAMSAAYLLLVLALFTLMGSWRAALVAALAVPLSVFAAGLVLHLRGVNINMMVVAGLTLAIGVVVDDAIHGVSNMLRRMRQARDEGKNASTMDLMVQAVMEVRRPMLFATLIIVLAATPVFFMHGVSAALFEPLASSYILAVLASMVVAMIATPALAVLLMAHAPLGEHAGPGLLGGLQKAYGRVATSTLRTVLPAVLLGLVSIPAAYLAWSNMERSMVPNFKETDVKVELSSAAGTSLTAMNRTTSALIQDLLDIKGVRNAGAYVGRAVLSAHADDVHTAEIMVSMDPAADYDDTMLAIQVAIDKYPGMVGDLHAPLSQKLREAITGDDTQLKVRVYGHDPAILQAKADDIRGVLAKISGIENAKAEIPEGKTTIQIKVDLNKAKVYGLKPGDVRRAASSMVAGITVGALFEDQKVFDVVVWGAPEVRANLASIRDMLIDVETPKGTQVRLADVADVSTISGPGVIRRHGVSRRIDVTANVNEDFDLSKVSQEAARQIKQVNFPFEYHAMVMGEQFSRNDTIKSMGSYLIGAALIAFLVMQSALGSWRLAMLSVLSVPVTVLGCLLAVAIAGGEFTLGSLLGIAGALALSVRNGIMQVRHFHHLEQAEGEDFGELLVLRGVRERFVPIMTSALALALFFLPFVVMRNSAGLEILNPMAVAALGGILAVTGFTLFVMPALYLRFGHGASAAANIDLKPVAAGVAA